MSDPEKIMELRAPGDVVAAIPYLLGFHPSERSLVILAWGGPHPSATVRFDIPDADNDVAVACVAARAAQMLAARGFTDTLLAGYGSSEQVDPMVYAVGIALLLQGLSVKDVLRIDQGRWWSYLDDADCAHAQDGTPYDIASSEVAARATYAGQAAFPSREDLAATLAPVKGEAREGMCLATAQAERRLREMVDTGAPWSQIRDELLAEVLPIIASTVEQARSGELHLSDEQVALLGVALRDLGIRDHAWVRIDQDDPIADIAVWSEVLRRVTPRDAAAPACLLAYAAHQSGDGTLANFALDRAEQADPSYSLTQLLRQVLAAGLPPSATRLRLTPEELTMALQEADGLDHQGPETSVDGNR